METCDTTLTRVTWGGKESDTTEQLSLHFKDTKVASQVALVVKNPPAMQELQEVWVQSLGQEDPLEEEMATHSSILARIIPWTEEPGKVRHD